MRWTLASFLSCIPSLALTVVADEKGNVLAQHWEYRFPHWWVGDWLCLIAHAHTRKGPISPQHTHLLPPAATTTPPTCEGNGDHAGACWAWTIERTPDAGTVDGSGPWREAAGPQMLPLRLNLCHFRHQIATWAVRGIDLLWFGKKQVTPKG